MAIDVFAKVRIGQLLNLQRSLLGTRTVEIRKLVVQAAKDIIDIGADPDSNGNDLLPFEDAHAFLSSVFYALPPGHKEAVDVNPEARYLRSMMNVSPEILIDAFRSVLTSRIVP